MILQQWVGSMGQIRLGGAVRVAPKVVVLLWLLSCHRSAWVHCTTAWPRCCGTPEAHFHWVKTVRSSPRTLPRMMMMLCPGEELLLLGLLLLLLRRSRSPSRPPVILL